MVNTMPTAKQTEYYLALCERTGSVPSSVYETWGNTRMSNEIKQLIAKEARILREQAEEPGGLPPERGEDIPEELVLSGCEEALLMDMEPDYTPEEYDPAAAREALKRMMEE